MLVLTTGRRLVGEIYLKTTELRHLDAQTMCVLLLGGV